MINKVNGIQTNSVAFKQNQLDQQPYTKSNLSLYKDNFIRSSMTLVPSSVIFAGLWALFDKSKGANFGKAFLHNAANFGTMSVIIAAVDSWFTTRAQTKHQ